MRRLRTGILVPLLLVPALMVYVAGPDAADLLRYERSAILQGQWWRLLSGHWVHLGAVHLLLNGVALVLLVALAGGRRPQSAVQLLTLPLALMLGTSAGLLLFNPRLDWYVGLSGLLHGLAVWVAINLWHTERLLTLVILAGVAGKLVWEQLGQTNPMLERSIGGTVLVDAHLYGAITAVVLCLAVVGWRKLRSARTDADAGTNDA